MGRLFPFVDGSKHASKLCGRLAGRLPLLAKVCAYMRSYGPEVFIGPVIPGVIKGLPKSTPLHYAPDTPFFFHASIQCYLRRLKEI
jgi:hypothetical protein